MRILWERPERLMTHDVMKGHDKLCWEFKMCKQCGSNARELRGHKKVLNQRDRGDLCIVAGPPSIFNDNICMDIPF